MDSKTETANHLIEEYRKRASEAVVAGDSFNELKLEINRLIWQYAPPETTLGTADEMACQILQSIMAGKYLR